MGNLSSYMSRIVHYFAPEDSSPLLVGIWGACVHQGQRNQGVEDAPNALREGGLVERLLEDGCLVIDHGNVRLEKGTDHTRQKEVASYGKIAYEKVKEIIGQGQIAVTLGGDHSIAIGTVAGHLACDPDCMVVWVDAHADINTMSSSATKNMHGMPLSFNISELQERPHPHMMDWLTPQLQPSQLVYIGLRDVDNAERVFLESLDIKAFYMTDVRHSSINEVVENALKTVDPEGIKKIHLSFDIDALDPQYAPATGTAVDGGLTLDEGLKLCDIVHGTGRLRAVDGHGRGEPHDWKRGGCREKIEAANKIVMRALGYGKSSVMDTNLTR